MIELAFALALAAAPQDAPTTDVRPSRQWGSLAWTVQPPLTYPAGEAGTLQAEVTCTIGREGRLQNCRIDRLQPRRSRFGTETLRALRRARLAEGETRPGDTTTFPVWACAPALPEGCRMAPWEDQAPTDRPAVRP